MIEKTRAPQIEDGYTIIANELLEALYRFDLSGMEWRVLAVIIRKSYGFRSKYAYLSFSKISRFTGINRRSVIRTVTKLIQKKVLTSDKDVTTPSVKGVTRSNNYKINKLYNEWIAGITYPQWTSDIADTTLVGSDMADTKGSDMADTHLVTSMSLPIYKETIKETIKETTRAKENTNLVRHFGTIESIDENAISEISEKYQVSIDFVKARLDDLITYCGAHGKKYKDYRLALINFVKSDSRKSLPVAPNTYGKLTIISAA